MTDAANMGRTKPMSAATLPGASRIAWFRSPLPDDHEAQ
jgi:hypothetical protein